MKRLVLIAIIVVLLALCACSPAKRIVGEWKSPDPCGGYEEGPSADRTLLSEPLISSTGWCDWKCGKDYHQGNDCSGIISEI